MAKRQKDRQHNGQKTEEHTTQWPKDRRTDNTMAKRQKNRQHNGQKKKDKQRSTKHTHKTKDRVTRTPLQNELYWNSLWIQRIGYCVKWKV
jgi:hypothetical protein